MENLKDYVNNSIVEAKSNGREPWSGEVFYNIDKPKWSKSIADDIEDAMRRLQRPIVCNKHDLHIKYLSNDFNGTRSYKTYIIGITCNKYGIVLQPYDHKEPVYIPLDKVKEKLKYWIEDEAEVAKVIEFIEDFDFK